MNICVIILITSQQIRTNCYDPPQKPLAFGKNRARLNTMSIFVPTVQLLWDKMTCCLVDITTSLRIDVSSVSRTHEETQKNTNFQVIYCFTQ